MKYKELLSFYANELVQIVYDFSPHPPRGCACYGFIPWDPLHLRDLTEQQQPPTRHLNEFCDTIAIFNCFG